MNKSTLLILILAGALLVSLFVNFDNSEVLDSIRKEKEGIESRSKQELKTLRDSARFERNLRRAIESDFIALERASKKSDSTTIYWRKRYTHEKNKNLSHFSDAGYDSLVNGLFPD